MNINKYFKKQKGAIILMFLVFLPFMLGFVGLAIDFGYIYAEKTKLQNAADAAALAGVVNMKKTNIDAYVKAMLEANDFVPTKDKATKDISRENNWKITFEQEPNGNNPPQETTNPSVATRLRVRVLKTITLTFLPILDMDLLNLDLTATAVARGTSDTSTNHEFQFIAMNTLMLGSKAHIPSYPEYSPNGFNIKNEIEKRFNQTYKDYDASLNKSIYASNLSFGSDSTLRVAAKLYTKTDYTSQLDQYIYMTDPKNYEPSTPDDKAIAEVKKLRLQGKLIAKNAKDHNAIIIDVDKYPQLSTGIGDYGLKPILAKYADKKGFFDGINILVPVIFRSTKFEERFSDKYEHLPENLKPQPFLIKNFNISFYNFEGGLIVEGGNIEFSGSQPPTSVPDGIIDKPKPKNDKQLLGDIYIFLDTNRDVDENTDITLPPPQTNAGNFTTVWGAIAPKDFTGVLYADSGIVINPANSYRRHTFSKTFATSGDISFPADGSRDTANVFTSMYASSKISLVE